MLLTTRCGDATQINVSATLLTPQSSHTGTWSLSQLSLLDNLLLLRISEGLSIWNLSCSGSQWPNTGVLPSPQAMPKIANSTKLYIFCFFLQTHTFPLKGSTLRLLFGMSELQASLLLCSVTIIKQNKDGWDTTTETSQSLWWRRCYWLTNRQGGCTGCGEAGQREGSHPGWAGAGGCEMSSCYSLRREVQNCLFLESSTYVLGPQSAAGNWNHEKWDCG